MTFIDPTQIKEETWHICTGAIKWKIKKWLKM
jgi:hypothetical protein